MLLLRPPGVYRVDRDSTLLAEVLARPSRGMAGGVGGARARGRDVLDVGTGTGVLALAAARAGARSVTAVDLSWRSTLATWLNCRLRGVPVTVRRGNLFEPVRGRRFDLVVANPPYVPTDALVPPRHRIGRCWDAGSDGRLLVDRLCAEVPEVLADGGTLLLLQSAVCGEAETLSRLAAAGLDARVVARTVVPFGPVMTARAELLETRGLIAPGQRDEEIVVVEAHTTDHGGTSVTGADRARVSRTMPEARQAERGRTRVEVTGEGPVLVRGPVEIVAPNGAVVRSDRPVTALCSCRRSRRFPLCDTSHRKRRRRGSA